MPLQPKGEGLKPSGKGKTGILSPPKSYTNIPDISLESLEHSNLICLRLCSIASFNLFFRIQCRIGVV